MTRSIEIETKQRGPKRGWCRAIVRNASGIVLITGWFADEAEALRKATA